MFKEFLTSTFKNKTHLIEFGDELANKGKQAIDLYREVHNVIEETNSWPHPMWWSNTFQKWSHRQGHNLFHKYAGTVFLETFLQVWDQIVLVKNVTQQQKLFFLVHKMELNKIPNLKNHTWKVDEDGFPTLEIERPKKKMSLFMVQDLEKENLRLKAELEALKGDLG